METRDVEPKSTQTRRCLCQEGRSPQDDHQRPLDEYYWQIGKEAGATLKDAPHGGRSLAADELAEQIGFKRVNLRQTIKFSHRATKGMAVKLRKARLPWRAIVTWLGVKPDCQFKALYTEMLGGFVNSNKIRQYIKTRFKKAASPHVSSDASKAVVQARGRVETLDALLEQFRMSFEEAGDSVSAAKRRALEKALTRAKQRVDSTLAMVKRP